MPIRAENREKAKVIIAVSCAVFAVLLVISLIISLVSLAQAKSRRDRLKAELNELNAAIERSSEDLDYYKSADYVEMAAREYLDMQGSDEIAFTGK